LKFNNTVKLQGNKLKESCEGPVKIVH